MRAMRQNGNWKNSGNIKRTNLRPQVLSGKSKNTGRTFDDAWLKEKFHTNDPNLLRGSTPRRVSVERVVAGPGLANIYEFLRQHWAFKDKVDSERDGIDRAFLDAPEDKKAAIVAKGANSGNVLCDKGARRSLPTWHFPRGTPHVALPRGTPHVALITRVAACASRGQDL